MKGGSFSAQLGSFLAKKPRKRPAPAAAAAEVPPRPVPFTVDGDAAAAVGVEPWPGLGQFPPPVVVGGVGGSGTRLISQCLSELGIAMGPDLNESADNLFFTLLFQRPHLAEVTPTSAADFDALAAVLAKALTGAGTPFTQAERQLVHQAAAKGRPGKNAQWLKERARRLLAQEHRCLPPGAPWGWKEPNSHVFLERLAAGFPGMKYIHVVRNGLDMAFSDNQNQLLTWGPQFLGIDSMRSERNSLRFWCAVHRRVQRLGAALGPRFLLVNFEDFCLRPDAGIRELCRFLDLPADGQTVDRLRRLVVVPKTIGRFKQQDLSRFAPADLEYVRTFGYATGVGEETATVDEAGKGGGAAATVVVAATPTPVAGSKRPRPCTEDEAIAGADGSEATADYAQPDARAVPKQSSPAAAEAHAERLDDATGELGAGGEQGSDPAAPPPKRPRVLDTAASLS